MDGDSLLNRKQVTKRRSLSLEPEQARRSLSRRRIPSESESDSVQRRRQNLRTVEKEKERLNVPQKKPVVRKHNDSDSESSYSSFDESSDRRRDTKYATTMIDKPIISSAPVVKTTNPNDATCREISNQNKSNLPVSLFDTSFQNTQDFLIRGPQVLAKETKTRKLRVRSGGKTKKHA